MNVLSVREISDRLREAAFHVKSVRGGNENAMTQIVIGPDDKAELNRILDALAAGYTTEVHDHEAGIEVILFENA